MIFSIFCLIIAIAPTFAMDNDTAIGVHNEDIVGADIYFDANVENDTGDGSINHPYKEFDTGKIPEGSVVHLANGEYALKGGKAYANLYVVGENPTKTVVKYVDAVGFTSKGSITLKDVSLVDLRVNVNSNANLTAINTIFLNSSGSNSAIYSSSGPSNVVLNNCTFSQNSAQYGGTINMKGGKLNIKNSLFINNHADCYGGAIACDDVEVTISNSRFISNQAMTDAGGAIYLKNSKLNGNKLELINCSAVFGGAITSLASDLNLNNSVSKNNRAKYYGGAIYKMYTSFELLNSKFENNSALNGGAVYAEMVEDFHINSNYFADNVASSTGGAVFSILSESYYDIVDKKLNNTFKNNNAQYNKDVYQNINPNLNIGSNNYTLLHYNPSHAGNLPQKYDLRDYGFVTPVKNQGNGGNCWAFSTLAALESAILKATGIAYNLSEENMKNIASKYSSYGWSMDTNVGGYDKMAFGYLAGWLGPVNESEDEYSPKSVLSPLLNANIHIQNIILLTRNNYTDNNAIKRAIMDYGAVSTSVYWSSSYISKTKNYYYDGSSTANHAVAIVGWDDNYDASNFKSKPEGNGAWIVKNSWGLSGDNGYYYVSYYDTKLAMPGKYASYTFILNDTIKYDKNYQYDIPGRTDYFLNQTDVVWYKNKFTATDNEYLAAVSTWFEKDTNWDLSVYVNNALKITQSGFTNPGYRTIDLNSLIPLKTGDVFEIEFKIKVDGDTGVPISESVSLNAEFYKEGVSFVSYDGKNWKDFYDLEWTYPEHTYASQVACIKAFTILNKINTNVVLEITDSFNPVEITARVLTQYGSTIKTGVVTFNVEGRNIKVNLNNGVAKLTYAFANTGKNTVKATFSADGYSASTSSITVDPTDVILKANDYTNYFGSFYYMANLVDENNRPVANKEIKFNVDNKEYIVKTDKNGLATIKPALAVGIYKIKIGFNDLSTNPDIGLEKTITIKSTINMPANNRYTLNSLYVANLVDSNGQTLGNSHVNVNVNGHSYVLSADIAGKIAYNIDLGPGSYQVIITNPITGEVKSQTINVVARITENKNLVMYYAGESVYKVKVFDDNGNAAKGVAVTFVIDGKSYSGISDSNGYASFIVDKTFNPKTYEITASYKGYNVSNSIVVKSTINLPAENVYTLNSLYSVNLVDNKGNKLSNAEINVTVNGRENMITTDENGSIVYNIDLAPGSYQIIITNPVTGEIKSQTINVVARIAENKSVVMYFGAGSSYTVRVFDDNGNVAEGVTVKFKINGKKYSRISNSDGYASFKIGNTFAPKTYTITATYKGYKVLNKVKVKPTLILKDKTVKRSKTFKYSVKLLNNKGKILKSKYVKVKFRGKTYKAKTNSKGIVTYKIKVNSKVGKFTITAAYGSAKISKKITVKK